MTCVTEKHFLGGLPDISFAVDDKQWVVLTKDLIVN